MLDCVYGVLKDFQLLVAALIGFSGVIITLRHNANLAKGQREAIRQHDSEILRKALVEELCILRGSFLENRKKLELSEGNSDKGVLVPISTLTQIFDKNIDKLGWFDKETISTVMYTYLSFKEYERSIRLFSIQPEHPHLIGHYLYVPQTNIEFLSHGGKVQTENLDKAISALSKPT